MQFTVNAKEFSDKLALVSQILPKRAFHPGLENVMLTASGDNTVTLFSTNLECSISAELKANNFDDFVCGTCLTSAEQLKNVVKSGNKNTNLSFTLVETEDEDFYLDIINSNNTIKLVANSIIDYPEFPQLTSFNYSVKKDAIAQISESLMHAVSKDQTKQVLTTFNMITGGNKAKFATCDGHRLAVAECQIMIQTGAASDLNINIPWVVFKHFKKIAKLAKKENEVFLAIEPEQELMAIKIGDDVITTRLHIGTYPNYSNLIPRQFTTTVEIETKPWIEAVRYLKSFTDPHKNIYHYAGSGIHILFNIVGSFCVLSVSVNDNVITKTMNNVVIKGNLKEIRFLPDYLLEAIEAIPSDCLILNMNEDRNPVVIKPHSNQTPVNDLTMLVMPYKVIKD